MFRKKWMLLECTTWMVGLALAACTGNPGVPAATPDTANSQTEISGAGADVEDTVETDTDATGADAGIPDAVDLDAAVLADGLAGTDSYADALNCDGGVKEGCPCDANGYEECCSDAGSGFGYGCSIKPGTKPFVKVWTEFWDCPCLPAAQCPGYKPARYCKW